MKKKIVIFIGFFFWLVGAGHCPLEEEKLKIMMIIFKDHLLLPDDQNRWHHNNFRYGKNAARVASFFQPFVRRFLTQI